METKTCYKCKKNKIQDLNKSYNCPQCGKEVLAKSTNNETQGLVIKSKLTFIDEDGKVLCRCKNCKNIIGLPLSIIHNNIK